MSTYIAPAIERIADYHETTRGYLFGFGRDWYGWRLRWRGAGSSSHF